GLSASWVSQNDNVIQLALAGNRIGVLKSGGDALVKEGGLSASWVLENDKVIQLELATGTD
ncbi:hypothetical protein, partial [Sphaerimonospora mesophila]|uniref:hypothetical protein n=1 Tax=Sphaerimonospora mesophila TaxID=37483 RepID=UPI001910E2D1